MINLLNICNGFILSKGQKKDNNYDNNTKNNNNPIDYCNIKKQRP